MTNSLFLANHTTGRRLFAVLILSVLLLLGEQRFSAIESGRLLVSSLLAPLYWVGYFPNYVSDVLSNQFAARTALVEENAQLRSQLFVLERRSQQLISLEVENRRLRQLLNATSTLDDRFLAAELIGVSSDPFSHQVILNRGLRDGVFVGQPVIDAFGLLGQVVRVDAVSSRVILITDVNHSVPVQVNRNGVRSTVSGIGDLHKLTLSFVPDTADIVVGDLLVTSGLGGRFPPGFPVAEVTHVERSSGAQFMQVDARPIAELDRARHLLLVDSENITRFDDGTDFSE
jgi:rod shape-determining protein MreC